MKILSETICPFVQRVRALLEAKGLNYEVEPIDLLKKPSWFLGITPTGKVPILVTDDGQALFESSAISEYVDEVYGEPLHPADPAKRAWHRAWCALAANNYLVQCSTQRSPSEEIFSERTKRFANAFAAIEGHLDKRPYFDGEHLCMVDIAWLPLLHRAVLIEWHTGLDFITGFPKVKRWQQALLRMEVVENSVPDDFEDKFVAFYLNDQTYLGTLKYGVREQLSRLSA